MTDCINSFEGEYGFLSNFYLCDIRYERSIYKSLEAAYQAAKTTDLAIRERIRIAETPGIAKKLGRKLVIRPNWDNIKLQIMEELVRHKFTSHLDLREKLLATNNMKLIEGNYWGDTFWGVCKGKGTNHLGQILMFVRQELTVQTFRK
jgi:ribA/ribD-fused uncharacterized protein